MISLEKLLQTFHLTGLTVIAGQNGVDREISTVAVLDAPDAPKWLKGKELILSSAYIFCNDSYSLKNFVLDLIEVGASGLGIKMGRFMEKLPKDVEDIANAADFPILSIPYSLVWTDIIAPFYALKYSLDNTSTAAKIHIDIIASVFRASKWSSKHLMQKMTELFSVPMAIVKKNNNIISDNNLAGVKTIFKVIADSKLLPPSIEKEIICTNGYFLTMRAIPLSCKNDKEYMVFMSRTQEIIDEINRVFDLLEVLSRENGSSVMDKKQIYQDFLLKVVTNKITADEIKNFEFNRNYNASGVIYNAIVLITAENYLDVYEHFKEVIWQHKESVNYKTETYVIYNSAAQEAVILLEYQTKGKKYYMDSWLRGLFKEVDSQLLAKGNGCIAVSSIFASLEALGGCYKEAYLARDIGRRLWSDQQKYFYTSISIFNLLKDIDVEKVDLGDIISLEDNQNKLSFDGIVTMEAFLESGNYKQSAAKMFIHENTMRYRIQKISNLLNINPENPVDAYSILTKIKIWRLFKKDTKSEK